MFGYESSLVRWKLQDGTDMDIMTTNFMMNYLYLAENVNKQTISIRQILQDIYDNNGTIT